MNINKLARSREYVIAISMTVLMAIVMTSAFPQIVSADAAFISAAVDSIVEEAPVAEFPVSKDVEPSYEMWVLATAYTSEVAQTDSTPCIPAMGSYNLCEKYDERGIADTIAANFLRLGRLVSFEIDGVPYIGDHTYTVRDRMNSKYNGTNRIDIWMPDKAEAIQFGARYIKMKVYPYRDTKR